MCLWLPQSGPSRPCPASQPRHRGWLSSLFAGRSATHQPPARPYPHKAHQRPHNPAQKSRRLYALHLQCRRYSHRAGSCQQRFPHAGRRPHPGCSQQFAVAIQTEGPVRKAGGYCCHLRLPAGGHITPSYLTQCGLFQKFQTNERKTSHYGSPDIWHLCQTGGQSPPCQRCRPPGPELRLLHYRLISARQTDPASPPGRFLTWSSRTGH